MKARAKSTAVHPHPHSDELWDAAVPRATRLAYAVHTQGAWDVAQITDPLRADTDELVALAVALAAMVDIDKTPAELLAWYDNPLHVVRGTDDEPRRNPRTPTDTKYANHPWTDDELREAHAAHVRGRHPKTTAGEVEYQRRRHLKNKARKQQEAAA